MAFDSFRLSTTMPVEPIRVYKTWLNAKELSVLTAAKATVQAKEGGKHTAYDGYITGRIEKLDEGKRIVQSWRTTEFAKSAGASVVEITLVAAKGGGTKLTLVHKQIPKGDGARYKEGWEKYYFAPMKMYFGALDQLVPQAAPAKEKTSGKKADKKKAPAKKADKKKAPAKKADKKKAPAKKADKKKAPAKKADKKKAPAKKADKKKAPAKKVDKKKA